jgi:hypothetical protein
MPTRAWSTLAIVLMLHTAADACIFKYGSSPDDLVG